MASGDPCKVTSCDRFQYSRNLCERHYNKEARLRRARGQMGRVPAARVRPHVAWLRHHGWSWKEMELHGRVNNQTVKAIYYNETDTVIRSAARSLLALPKEWNPTRLAIPADGTRRRLQALAWMHWPMTEIIPRIGRGTHCVSFNLPRPTVTADLACQVDRVYRELRETRGPSQRIHDWAIKRKWVAPAAWDDDTIDDPNTVPEGAINLTRRANGMPLAVFYEEYLHLGGAAVPAPVMAERFGIEVGTLEINLSRYRKLAESGGLIPDTPTVRFGHHAIRTVDVDGTPWWVAADICKPLGLINPHHHVSRIDPSFATRTGVRTNGQTFQAWVVNKSGLDALTHRSTSPDAPRLRSWADAQRKVEATA